MQTETYDKRLKSGLIPHAGQLLEPEEFELKSELLTCQDVLEEVAAVLRSLAHAKGLRFDLLVPVSPIKIQTDRQVLNQILLNLADHAIRVSEHGGAYIELRRRLDANFSKVSTEFNVENIGLGLQPDQQRQVSRRQRKPEISAVSYLSQCQRLARLIGGRIEMMSVPGQGTVFRLVLPEK